MLTLCPGCGKPVKDADPKYRGEQWHSVCWSKRSVKVEGGIVTKHWAEENLPPDAPLLVLGRLIYRCVDSGHEPHKDGGPATDMGMALREAIECWESWREGPPEKPKQG